jgi:predicted anti-sigma-YlaC factor YlaD
MDCGKFQDQLSDYLDGALEARLRAECAAHRLVCGGCRELYNDVQALVQSLGALGGEPYEPAGLESRIIAATTAGEMFSCGEFDRLIERYFDGVMLAPDHQAFQSHFEQCAKCRRLLSGIEDAVGLCRAAKEADVEMPASLPERIMAATSGPNPARKPGTRLLSFSLAALAEAMAERLFAPQWAAGCMIFAASMLLVSVRFGSVEGLVSHANAQAEKVLTELNQSGRNARSSLNQASYQFGNKLFPTGKQPPAQERALEPAVKLDQSAPQTTPSPALQHPVRYRAP